MGLHSFLERNICQVLTSPGADLLMLEEIRVKSSRQSAGYSWGAEFSWMPDAIITQLNSNFFDTNETPPLQKADTDIYLITKACWKVQRAQ